MGIHIGIPKVENICKLSNNKNSYMSHEKNKKPLKDESGISFEETLRQTEKEYIKKQIKILGNVSLDNY